MQIGNFFNKYNLKKLIALNLTINFIFYMNKPYIKLIIKTLKQKKVKLLKFLKNG